MIKKLTQADVDALEAKISGMFPEGLSAAMELEWINEQIPATEKLGQQKQAAFRLQKMLREDSQMQILADDLAKIRAALDYFQKRKGELRNGA